MKKFSRFLIPVAVGAAIALPLLAAAQTGININYVTPYSTGIINVINRLLVPVIIAIAFVVFIWGVYKYFIYGADNETERETGRQFVLWGVIGFVIILSLWGLVNLVMGTFGLSVGSPPPFPTIGNATGVTTSGNQVFTGGTNTGQASTGSNVFSSNGSYLGRVNSSGQIVNSNGQVVGRIQNGQPYTLSGTPMTGATTGSAVNQDVTACDSATIADCEAAGKTCSVSSGIPQCVSTSDTDDTAQETCTPPEIMGADGQCTYMVAYPCPDGSNAVDAASCPTSDEPADTTYCTDEDGEVVPCY